jgi:hypothetical protein
MVRGRDYKEAANGSERVTSRYPTDVYIDRKR